MAFKKKNQRDDEEQRDFVFCLMLIVDGIILTCKIKSSVIRKFVQKYVFLCYSSFKKDTFQYKDIKFNNFKKEWGKKRKKNLRKYIDGMH